MIKFFRKFRQKMLNENRFSKYLIYAIGEIILVVIGILIALQINNWSQYTKERALEIEILKEIKETHNLIIEEDVFAAYGGSKIVLCGTGAEKTKEVFKTKGYDFLPFQLSAKYLITLAHQRFAEENFENLVSYSPNYFKAPRITKSKKPLF